MLAATREHYKQLGLEKGKVALWEDGMRTDGGRGSFEWWYFDANLTDGSRLVIIFYTKDFTDVSGPSAPFVSVEFDRADGTTISREFHAKSAAEFSASKEQCDVRIGPNRFSGDLHSYAIHVEIDGIVADVTLTGEVPSWRPETGTWFFGADAQKQIAWLPSVPQGQVTATLTLDGATTTLSGTGYHDHNWGNTAMNELLNHWYWARGKVGAYTVIAAHLTAESAYGDKQFPIFMLAQDGVVIADDGSKVQFNANDIYTDSTTGKPVANTTVYEYRDDPQHVVVTFQRQHDLLAHKFIDDIKGWKHAVAWLMGVDAAYIRFAGDVTLQRYEGGALAQTDQEQAIWELMYFGERHAGEQ